MPPQKQGLHDYKACCEERVVHGAAAERFSASQAGWVALRNSGRSGLVEGTTTVAQRPRLQGSERVAVGTADMETGRLGNATDHLANRQSRGGWVVLVTTDEFGRNWKKQRTSVWNKVFPPLLQSPRDLLAYVKAPGALTINSETLWNTICVLSLVWLVSVQMQAIAHHLPVSPPLIMKLPEINAIDFKVLFLWCYWWINYGENQLKFSSCYN